MNIKTTLILAISGSLLFFSFQNCSMPSNPISFAGNNASKSTQDMEGGGQPYDGKVYVLTGATCPDGTSIHTRIIVRSSSSGSLLREKCQDITPVELTANDFQLVSSDPNKIYFRAQALQAENFVNVAASYPDGGFAFWVWQDFGTPADSPTNYTRSILRVFENGVEMGPAHSSNTDIQNLGSGRFTHWENGLGPALMFSASDNSDPRTNGRKYTYVIGY